MRGAKLVRKESVVGRQRAASSDYIRYFINISLRKQNQSIIKNKPLPVPQGGLLSPISNSRVRKLLIA